MKRTTIDWAEPAFRRDPYPVYAYLRRVRPMAMVSDRRWYAVSRYEDVRSVLERSDLFSSAVMRRADPTLLGADPPEHTVARRIVQSALAAGGDVRRIVEQAASELADCAAQRQRWDFVGDYAAVLPAMVMTRLLRLDATPAELLRWARVSTPRVGERAPCAQEKRQALEFDFRLADLIGRRVEAPDCGVISGLATSGSGRPYLSSEQAHSVARIILIGGVETTTHWLGNTMRALLNRPGLLADAAEDKQVCERLVVEALRYDPPVQAVLRKAMQPVQIGGLEAPAGSTISALLGSANRDEAVFDRPDDIRLDRPVSAPALTFGRGPHACLGARLAKLQVTVGLHELLRRIPSITAGEDLRKLRMADSLHLRGPARLMVQTAL